MRRSWRAYLVVACVVLCWLGVALVVLPRLGDPASFDKTPDPASPAMTEASSQTAKFRGNVYHIIFDSYQSEAYPYFLDKTPEPDRLPFTYYPNFRVSRVATYFSMAELFAGDFYSPDMPSDGWHNAAFQNGMMAYLANGGVQLDLYPYYSEYCYRGGHTVCKTTMALRDKVLGAGRTRQTALDLWFLKLIPISLKRELNARFAPPDEGAPAGDSFSNWDYGFSIFNAITQSSAPGDPDKPYLSVQQFMQFLAEEDARPATGQYVFLHLLLPHGAMVLNHECTYVGRATTQTPQGPYFEQVQCANKLLDLLVDKLAALGRLDNSLIIAQADHGHYMHPADLGALYQYLPLDVSVPRLEPDEADSSTWPSEAIEVRASALLLIKFPGRSAASRSDEPVQMIDIAPTILRYFDIDPGVMRGMPIQDMPALPPRERFFFASSERIAPNLFSKYRYVDGRWKFEESVETFTSADQLFTIRLAH